MKIKIVFSNNESKEYENVISYDVDYVYYINDNNRRTKEYFNESDIKEIIKLST